MIFKKLKFIFLASVAMTALMIVAIGGASAELPCWNDGTIAQISGGSKGLPVVNDPDPQKAQKAAEPVILVNGSFDYETEDIILPSARGPSIAFKRYYNSLDIYDGPLGIGWNHSYNIVLVKTQDANGTYILKRSPEGDKVDFTLTSNGVYVPEAGYYDVVTEDASGYTLTEKYGTRYRFGLNGYLVSITDRNNNSLTFTYDGSGRLARISDSVGRFLVFSYNDRNKINRIEDNAGRAYSYAYDTSSNLVSVTAPPIDEYPSGMTTTYTYGDKHNLVSIIDGNAAEYLYNNYDEKYRVVWQRYNGAIISILYDTANVTRRVYDGAGNMTLWLLNADGTASSRTIGSLTTSYEYNGGKELTRLTYPKGNIVEYTYDTYGNITRVKRLPIPGSTDSPLITDYTYEAPFNQVKTITDPMGRVTTYTYNNGNLTGISYPPVNGEAATESFTYNAFGQLETAADPNGIVTRYEYYADTGLLKKRIKAYTTALQSAEEFVYDGRGNVASIKDPIGNSTAYTYNALNRVTDIVSSSPFGYETKFAYDANLNIVRISRETLDPADPWQNTDYTYTVLDKVSSIRDDAGHVSTFGYDANGMLAAVTDAESHTTTYGYDSRLLLTSVTDALNQKTEYSYDDNGNLLRIRDAGGNETVYTYDDFERMTGVTYPDGSAERYSYDPNGNLISKITRNGDTISYTYDELGRLTVKTTPEGSVTYTYDAGSRLLSVEDSTGVITYEYDELNRVKRAAYPGNKSIGYAYDLNGNISRLTYPDDTYISYEYDAMDRQTDIKDMSGQAICHYAYDALSRRVSMSYSNGASASYTYDTAGNLTSLVNAFTGASETFTYTYDSVGNRLTRTTSLRGALRQAQADEAIYTYDDIYQVTAFAYSGGRAVSYSYDALGNRRSVSAGSVTAYTANNMNQYTSVGAVGYTYDLNGNLLYDGVNTYSYDSENRLVHATSLRGSEATEAIYAYDPFGRRVSSSLRGTEGSEAISFLYDGDQIIAEYDGSGNVTAKYVYGAGIDEMICKDVIASPAQQGEAIYFYHYDGLGSVTNLTDTTGTAIESYTYDVFGKPNSASSVGNTRMFTGRDYDSETGLYYYRARYYDPKIGRFLQLDPFDYMDGANVYRYVRNNPVNLIDPWGYKPGDKYSSQGTAAKDALTDIYRPSVTKDKEYAGWIYRNSDGTYSYTPPREGATHSSDPGSKPSDGTAYYHSHGAESGPDYDDENFSNYYDRRTGRWQGDVPYANGYGVDGYLITPSGSKKEYNHSKKDVTEPAELKEGTCKKK